MRRALAAGQAPPSGSHAEEVAARSGAAIGQKKKNVGLLGFCCAACRAISSRSFLRRRVACWMAMWRMRAWCWCSRSARWSRSSSLARDEDGVEMRSKYNCSSLASDGVVETRSCGVTGWACSHAAANCAMCRSMCVVSTGGFREGFRKGPLRSRLSLRALEGVSVARYLAGPSKVVPRGCTQLEVPNSPILNQSSMSAIHSCGVRCKRGRRRD